MNRMSENYLELYDFQSKLKAGVEALFPSRLWVKAEISSIKANRHCYLELTQSDSSGRLIAKVKAAIWESRYRFLAPMFKSVTGSPLQVGMTVLVEIQVTYSPLYDLTLVVNDIDPEFSLGELEKQRQMTIARLQQDGVMEMQKELELPLLPMKFAVISAADAAGYRDFMKHLDENIYGFHFDYELYPALMQGTQCPSSIISALNAVMDSGVDYDAVLILRGGGSRIDLACYDDYELCSAIAQYPLPVMTAVGHDQDYHIADMVAHLNLKTPTALADELVSIYAGEDERISTYWSRIVNGSVRKITDADAAVRLLQSRLRNSFLYKIGAMESKVDLLESRISGADPRNVLKRGYVLALDGKGVVLKQACGTLNTGDQVGLMFHDGVVHCQVNHVEKKKMI